MIDVLIDAHIARNENVNKLILVNETHVISGESVCHSSNWTNNGNWYRKHI